jgi:hypothetical protein
LTILSLCGFEIVIVATSLPGEMALVLQIMPGCCGVCTVELYLTHERHVGRAAITAPALSERNCMPRVKATLLTCMVRASSATLSCLRGKYQPGKQLRNPLKIQLAVQSPECYPEAGYNDLHQRRDRRPRSFLPSGLPACSKKGLQAAITASYMFAVWAPKNAGRSRNRAPFPRKREGQFSTFGKPKTTSPSYRILHFESLPLMRSGSCGLWDCVAEYKRSAMPRRTLVQFRQTFSRRDTQSSPPEHSINHPPCLPPKQKRR